MYIREDLLNKIKEIFDSKKPFYKKTLKEIFFPKRAKAEEVAKKLEKRYQ